MICNHRADRRKTSKNKQLEQLFSFRVAFRVTVALCLSAARWHHGGNMLGMVAAGIIIMRQQHHVSAAQGFVVFGAPLASAHRIRRRDEAESGNVVRVFLPLANKDRRPVSDRLGDIRQSVQYQRGCVECPALALCWPLGESGFLEWQPILRRSHAHIFSGSETPDPKSAFGGGSPLSKGLW